MDVRLLDNDLYLTPTGRTEYISGTDEAVQRAVIACTVRKRSFIYDRELGADTDDLDGTSPFFERELEMVLREAAFSVPDTQVKVISVRKNRGKHIVRLRITHNGETRETEVIPYGKLSGDI